MAFESRFGSGVPSSRSNQSGDNPWAERYGSGTSTSLEAAPTGFGGGYMPWESLSREADNKFDFYRQFNNQSYQAAVPSIVGAVTGAAQGAIQQPYQDALSFLQAFNAPTLQGFKDQQSGLLGLQAATDANFLAQKGFLKQGNALDKALLKLQEQGIGIQQKGLGAEHGFLDKRYGFLDRLRALAEGGFTNTQAQINEKAEQQHRATRNDFVGRGATVAPEHGLQHEDIDQETAMAIEAARLGYEKEKVGLDEQGLSLDEQRHRLNQAGELLGLDLQKLGINSQQLNLQLEMGLANLGLDQLMSTNDFWNKLKSSQGEELAFWQQLFQQAFQWGMMGDALKGLMF